MSPIALDAAQKLKALFEGLSPDITVNITTLAGDAIQADDATTAAIAEWKKQHGLS